MKRIFKFSCLALLLAAVFAGCIAGWVRPGLLRGTPNDGHQLGGDLMPEIPGNTLEAFEAAITKLESRPKYLYSECDIRETKDNQLVVFHDWDIRGVPNTDRNRESLGEDVGKQPVCELTLEQLQGLELEGGCRIPTLEEVLQKAIELKPAKPLLLEVKYLHSKAAGQQLIQSAKQFRSAGQACELEIHFLAFIRNINRSFPNPEQWLEECSKNGFRVYQAFRPKTEEYDLCETWN